MTKFMLLYSGGNGMPETEEETAIVMKAWEDWYAKLGNAVADPGNPLMPASKKIAPNGAVSDGAVFSMATGYTIITAESFDQAVEMAKGCPVLVDGSEVSVYEIFNVMS
jgi:hypothetical protein